MFEKKYIYKFWYRLAKVCIVFETISIYFCFDIFVEHAIKYWQTGVGNPIFTFSNSSMLLFLITKCKYMSHTYEQWTLNIENVWQQPATLKRKHLLTLFILWIVYNKKWLCCLLSITSKMYRKSTIYDLFDKYLKAMMIQNPKPQ